MIILCCTLTESPIQNNHKNNFQVHCTHLLVNSVCLHVCTVLLCTYSLVSLCCIKVWWGGLVGDTPCRPHLATASYSLPYTTVNNFHNDFISILFYGNYKWSSHKTNWPHKGTIGIISTCTKQLAIASMVIVILNWCWLWALTPDFPQCIEPWAGWTGCVRWRWVWCTKRNCAPPRHQHPPGRGGCSRSRWPAWDHWPLVYTTRVWWNVQPTLTLLHTSYLRLFQVQLIFSTSQKYPLPPTMSQNVINGIKIGFWIDWQLIRYCFWTNDSETILCTLH